MVKDFICKCLSDSIDSFIILCCMDNNKVTACPEKPGSVGEFDSCEGTVGKSTKCVGKYLVRDNCLLLT